MQAKYGLVLVAIIALATLGISMQTQDAYASHTVTICHSPGVSQVTITISVSALATHLGHGDYIGTCIPLPKPTVVLTTTSTDPTSTTPIPVTATFSEEMKHTGSDSFTLSDITVKHGTASNLATSDFKTFTFDVTPTIGDDEDDECEDEEDECEDECDDVKVEIEVKKDKAKSLAYNQNNLASNKLKITYEPCEEPVPIVDTDGDGIPDETDQCPADAETFNGFQDEDGCPDAIKSGGQCTNCQPPTLGLDKGGDISHRLVEGGFTCEGQTVDVDNYYTPFPLITNGVGDPLNCVFKIYEDTGADKITHFEFAVGKRAGDSMSEEQGKISWSKNIMTEEETVTYDHNLFRSVGVTTGEDLVNCKSDSEVALCLQITLTATPKEPLVEDIIVKTNVWDSNHNGKTNFYNDGIDFVGNTENPMPFYQVLDGKNGAFMIYTTDPTLENLNTAIDQFGQTWTRDNNGFWSKDYVPVDRSCDSSSRGFDRLCPEFNMMKQGQILLAQQHFDSSKIQSTLPDVYAINYPERD